jgi:hypothetical protein
VSLSFAEFKIPPYKYFPTHLIAKQGPKQWARVRFLQACERVNIPSTLWPKFQDLSLPRDEYSQEFGTVEPFYLPSFHALYETEAEWRNRSRDLFEQFLDAQAANFRGMLQSYLNSGMLTKIKPVRGTAPLELRYEWAARRYGPKSSSRRCRLTIIMLSKSGNLSRRFCMRPA